MRIEYHRTLIDDRIRVEAFHEALKRVIRPGESVVADIGAGTGLIGAMAAKLGAKKVYLYEAAEVASVAAQVLKLNRVRNAELFACHSTEFDDPPRADIVVSETLGNYALEEDIIETMADAARRHLKPGGTLIPSRILQFAAPMISPRVDRELRAWDRASAGLTEIDLSPAKTLTLNNIYVRTIAPEELLSVGSPLSEVALPSPPPEGEGGRRPADGRELRHAASVWDRIDLGHDTRAARRGEASWPIAADAAIYGFALWWTADLVPGVTLSTAPDAPPTHWEQLYLPLLEPIAARAGDGVALSIKSRTSREEGTTIGWSASHTRSTGETVSRQNMDLEKGFLP